MLSGPLGDGWGVQHVHFLTVWWWWELCLETVGKGEVAVLPVPKPGGGVFPSDTKLRDSDHKGISKVRKTKKKKTNYTF